MAGLRGDGSEGKGWREGERLKGKRLKGKRRKGKRRKGEEGNEDKGGKGRTPKSKSMGTAVDGKGRREGWKVEGRRDFVQVVKIH